MVKKEKSIPFWWWGVFGVFLLGSIAGGLYMGSRPSQRKDNKSKTIEIGKKPEVAIDRIENGVHVRTGLVEGKGLMTVVQNCTTCHSGKLVSQNRMTREQWQATIRWMQETQNLWPLGDNEEIILDYLATFYAPDKKGRRQNLTNVDWYELK